MPITSPYIHLRNRRRSFVRPGYLAPLLAVILTVFSGTGSMALRSPGQPISPTRAARTRLLMRGFTAFPSRFLPALGMVHQLALGATFSPLAGMTIPIFMCLSADAVVGGVNSVSVSVTVDRLGDSIQIGTDRPDLLNSPSRKWPYVIPYECGTSYSRTFTLTTNATRTDTVVTIYACRSGVDPKDPANWSVYKTLTICALSESTGSSRR